LYTWRNGEDEQCTTSLFDEHHFLPLEVAIQEYNSLVSLYSEPDEDIEIDFNDVFPFAMFMGSYYAIYCGRNQLRGLQYPILRIFQGVELWFNNMETMIQTIDNWHAHGAYYQKTLDAGLKKHIWSNLNPNLPVPI
jgi:hypothetical protein